MSAAPVSTASADRVLVAGIGNVFLGDDGFGVEVAGRLRQQRQADPAVLPARVDVVDYGIRGVHLAYELLEGRYASLIMVDAVPVEGPPGTLTVLDVSAEAAGDQAREDGRDGGEGDGAGPAVDGHSLHPQAVLHLLRRLGGKIERAFVVGCRPGVLDEVMGLSDPVSAAVDEAARITADLARGEAARLTGPHGGPGPAHRRHHAECTDA